MSTCETHAARCQSGARYTRARALEHRAAGKEMMLRGDVERARAELELGIRAAGDDPIAAEIHADVGVLHHQVRDLDAARARYERALTLTDDPAVRARTIGNLGALDHDERRFEAALGRYTEAVATFRALRQDLLEGTFLANMAVLLQEKGATPRARATYDLALERLAGADRRLEAITRSNLGLLHHELGEHDEARSAHEEALALFQEATDARSEGLCHGRLAMAAAALGRHADARASCERGEAMLREMKDGVSLGVMQLFRAYVELSSSADVTVARERVAHARALVAQSDDARTVVRLIEAKLARAGSEGTVLRIGPAASWVAAAGEARTDLSSRLVLQRLLLRLVESHRASPGEGVTLDELRQAGWPDERALQASALNRVHVALTELRRRGLRSVLQRRQGRYLIDPAVRIELE